MKKAKKAKKAKVTLEVNLPYYKQGDDLRRFLEETNGDIHQAFKKHAEMCCYAAGQLRCIAGRLWDSAEVEVEVEADTHSILLYLDEGPLADALRELNCVDDHEVFE